MNVIWILIALSLQIIMEVHYYISLWFKIDHKLLSFTMFPPKTCGYQMSLHIFEVIISFDLGTTATKNTYNLTLDALLLLYLLVPKGGWHSHWCKILQNKCKKLVKTKSNFRRQGIKNHVKDLKNFFLAYVFESS